MTLPPHLIAYKDQLVPFKQKYDPESITLYSAAQSLYAGRARSYFIKSGIKFEEQTPAQCRFYEVVTPKAGGRSSMPLIEFPDGTVIRDGVAIIDHFEAQRGHPATPPGACQRVVSLLFDVIGAEGLIRPAMHYRWNFDAEQGDFIRYHFRSLFGGLEEPAESVMRNIKRTAVPDWGVSDLAIPLIEELYEGFLDKFDAHLKHHPYLLGAVPSVGDFGLIAPLFGHLGRDPVPLRLMQMRAPWVHRWVERMNSPEPDTGDYLDIETGFLPNDEVPDTLIDLLRHIAIDLVPETIASHAVINRWLATHDVAHGSTCKRYAGEATFQVNGTEVHIKAQPFRFYLLSRVQEAVAALSADQQVSALALFEQCDMSDLLDLRLDRGIGRANNLEVWLG